MRFSIQNLRPHFSVDRSLHFKNKTFFFFYSDHLEYCDIVCTKVYSHRHNFIKRRKKKRRKRIKRDRSLLAVSGPKYWPRWCHKVAFFRVFQKDFTLCLYKNRFRDDPILAFSNPTIGTTIYGYWNKKYYQELGKYIKP